MITKLWVAGVNEVCKRIVVIDLGGGRWGRGKKERKRERRPRKERGREMAVRKRERENERW